MTEAVPIAGQAPTPRSTRRDPQRSRAARSHGACNLQLWECLGAWWVLGRPRWPWQHHGNINDNSNCSSWSCIGFCSDRRSSDCNDSSCNIAHLGSSGHWGCSVCSCRSSCATFLQFACETQDSMDAQSPSADPVSKGFRRGYSMPLAISAKGVGATTALFSEAPCGVAHMLPSRIQILQALRQRSRCWGASGIRILLHSLDLPFRVPWSTSWPVQIWEPDCTWTQSSTGRPACRLPTTSAKALHSCKGVAPRFSTATSSSTMFCSISEVLLRLLRLQTSAWLCCLKPPPSTLRWSGGHQCPRFRATRVMLWHHLLWAVDPWRDCPRATANLCGRKSTSRTSMAGALGRLAH